MVQLCIGRNFFFHRSIASFSPIHFPFRWWPSPALLFFCSFHRHRVAVAVAVVRCVIFASHAIFFIVVHFVYTLARRSHGTSSKWEPPRRYEKTCQHTPAWITAYAINVHDRNDCMYNGVRSLNRKSNANHLNCYCKCKCIE